ncbi:MAG: reverse transcriptase/maturase family protein [Candidatus Moraniibacteriota bacterium]
MRGKRKRKDVAEFSLNFMDNVLALHEELKVKIYKHGNYQAFRISDPKPRDIHKAKVRDRLIHHAIYRIIRPYFESKFMFDSYSCRIKKGTHKAVNRFRCFSLKVSKNNTKQCWILKCDIKKFFASIDHEILKNILSKYIGDENVLWLFSQVIDSFNTKGKSNVGLPLGNLTSQLLVNIYMNEFDQFAKRELKTKYYIRYADDFAIFHEDKNYLENLIPKISEFLETKLKLSLHPSKVSIKTLTSGVDFLGWVNFPKHRILRTSTKRRMMKKLRKNNKAESVVSYLGLLSHGDGYKLANKIAKLYSEKMIPNI